MTKLINIKDKIKKIYEKSITGCCMHIVIDDGNIDDENIDFCINFAKDNKCKLCEDVGMYLKRKNKYQRKKIIGNENV